MDLAVGEGRRSSNGDRVGMTREIAEKMGLPRKLEATCRTYNEMRKRGIRVVIGGDYGFKITPMGQNARDIGHFVKFFGYSPAEALRCATSVGGELMGLKGEPGVIRPGALADILLVEGNPLADPSVPVGPDRLAMIMKDGKTPGSESATRRARAESCGIEIGLLQGMVALGIAALDQTFVMCCRPYIFPDRNGLPSFSAKSMQRRRQARPAPRSYAT